MNKAILDIYSDFLLTTFTQATATGLAAMVGQAYSHDQITRFLDKPTYTQREYWQIIKPIVRQIEDEDGAILVDDTIEEKPYTDESELVCWHYDHTQGRSVKGINLINFVYHVSGNPPVGISIPLAYEVVTKPEVYQDPKTGQYRRRSDISKNERVRERLKIITHFNRVSYRYVLADSWFSSRENMIWIKETLQKDFIMALKNNRLVAVSQKERLAGQFVAIADVDLAPGETRLVYLKNVSFPVLITKQIFTNEDGSTGTLYLVTSDTTMTYDQITRRYQTRWQVEVVHKSLKQNAALEKSPTKTQRSQQNHIFAAMVAVVKLETLKIHHRTNHFAIKQKLYLKAIQAAYDELKQLNSQTFNFVKSAPA